MVSGVQLTPYTIPLALVVGLCAAGASIAWHQREGRAEVWTTLIQVAIGLWTLANLLSLSLTAFVPKVWALLLFVPTIPLLVVTTLLFVVHFCGLREWSTPWRRRALFAFPAATLALSVTNWYHGLVFENLRLETGGAFVSLTYEFGPLLYVVSGLSFLVVAVYLGLLVRQFRRSRNVYRKLSLVIAVTILVLTVAAAVSVAGASPVPHFLLVPFSYLLVGALLLAGTTSSRFVRRLPVDRLLAPVRSRFDSTVPLARDFVMQEVDNGIVVLDADDRVVDINRTAQRMLGVERLVGKHVTDIGRPSLILDGGELLPVLEGDAPVRELRDEIRVDTQNGRRWYEVRVSALGGDADGDGTDDRAHIVLIHDVTEQNRRAERLQRQTEELEAKTTQLEHQNERLDEFASIVSHDIRNPLNVATSRVELMLATGADEGAELTVRRSDLEEIRAAHERMEAIIDDALTLARQGKAITETERVDLAAVARRAWENVDTGDATVEIDCVSTIEADRDRLLNVFENLFRNAVEHGAAAEADAVTVTVGEIDDDGEGGFYVADDGPGIPDEQKEAVLEHGYTTSDDGTGLGLAIVADIANAHGWRVVVVDGAGGDGARFEVRGVERGEAATVES